MDTKKPAKAKMQKVLKGAPSVKTAPGKMKQALGLKSAKSLTPAASRRFEGGPAGGKKTVAKAVASARTGLAGIKATQAARSAKAKSPAVPYQGSAGRGPRGAVSNRQAFQMKADARTRRLAAKPAAKLADPFAGINKTLDGIIPGRKTRGSGVRNIVNAPREKVNVHEILKGK